MKCLEIGPRILKQCPQCDAAPPPDLHVNPTKCNFHQVRMTYQSFYYSVCLYYSVCPWKSAFFKLVIVEFEFFQRIKAS